MIVQADAFCIPLRDGTAQCCITSPPYWSNRSYGEDPRELGGGSLAGYVDSLVTIGRELWRVLDSHGVWWLNLGDSAAKSGGSGGDYKPGRSKAGFRKWAQGESGIEAGSWCGVPWEVAFALRRSGWFIRSHVTWDKQGVRPEDPWHVRRPLIASESIFMLTKTGNAKGYRFYPTDEIELGDVWHFPPKRGARQHDRRGEPYAAPFPDELPSRCMVLTTLPGDVVLDPFCGSGTTLRVAEEMERHGIGLDLYA